MQAHTLLYDRPARPQPSEVNAHVAVVGAGEDVVAAPVGTAVVGVAVDAVGGEERRGVGAAVVGFAQSEEVDVVIDDAVDAGADVVRGAVVDAAAAGVVYAVVEVGDAASKAE